MDQIKAWAITIIGMSIGMILVAVSVYLLPVYLDHWDKARARTRIEIKDLEATADFLRGQRVKAALIGN